MQGGYSNKGNIAAGEKDPHVIRETVLEIARKAREKLGRGNLTDCFDFESGFEDWAIGNDHDLTHEAA